MKNKWKGKPIISTSDHGAPTESATAEKLQAFRTRLRTPEPQLAALEETGAEDVLVDPGGGPSGLPGTPELTVPPPIDISLRMGQH